MPGAAYTGYSMGQTGMGMGMQPGQGTNYQGPGLNGVPINSMGQGSSRMGSSSAAPQMGQGTSQTNGGVSTLAGGGGAGFNVLSTLTPQQQQIMNQLQMNIANPNTGINPQQTANYIQQSVATPMLRQFDQSIMPRINDAYASVGALMGSRRGFAGQQALQNLQDNIGQQLGKAQLSNQQLQANLGLGYNELGAKLTGQDQMAIQPFNSNSGSTNGGATPFGGSFGQNSQSQNFGGYNMFGGGGFSAQQQDSSSYNPGTFGADTTQYF